MEDELSDEPWFHINPGDIFPAEFESFLGLSGDLRHLFKHQHGDLFDVPFWQTTQARLHKGEQLHIYPYAQNLRLHTGKDQ
jgi:isocitrate dehydrogenase kinase/phosphatase